MLVAKTFAGFDTFFHKPAAPVMVGDHQADRLVVGIAGIELAQPAQGVHFVTFQEIGNGIVHELTFHLEMFPVA